MGSQITTATGINSIVNQFDNANAHPRIVNAIHNAAAKTGVDFSFLMQKASQESSFNPVAKATTSSATGLFQFTTQTWLHMIKTYGDQHGLGHYADKITKGSDGRLGVADPAMRQEILALRKDPQVSAEMAAELDKENEAALQRRVGGKIGRTELYLAHFLGASGASKFIRQMRADPNVSGAEVMPTAAASNPSVFYAKNGEPLSVQQIYQRFAQKFDAGSTRLAAAQTKSITGASSNDHYINGIARNMASSRPSIHSATINNPAAADALSNSRLSTLAKTDTMTTLSESTTLFNAMLIGQIQDIQLNATSALSTYNRENEDKNERGSSKGLFG